MLRSNFTLLVLVFTSCTEPGDEPKRVDGHEFHPINQSGTLRFVDGTTDEPTEYEIGTDDCSWRVFATRKTDSWDWAGDRPRIICELEADRLVTFGISTWPSSYGWPESSSSEDGFFELRLDGSSDRVERSTELQIELTRSEGEVLPVPSGATADTPDLELATDDYVREYTVEAEVDCSDDPECGGIWTLELHVTQTADDVVPLFVYDD